MVASRCATFGDRVNKAFRRASWSACCFHKAYRPRIQNSRADLLRYIGSIRRRSCGSFSLAMRRFGSSACADSLPFGCHVRFRNSWHNNPQHSLSTHKPRGRCSQTGPTLFVEEQLRVHRLFHIRAYRIQWRSRRQNIKIPGSCTGANISDSDCNFQKFHIPCSPNRTEPASQMICSLHLSAPGTCHFEPYGYKAAPKFLTADSHRLVVGKARTHTLARTQVHTHLNILAQT